MELTQKEMLWLEQALSEQIKLMEDDLKTLKESLLDLKKLKQKILSQIY